MGSPEHEITGLLQAWRSGDDVAEQRLIPLVYAELRRLAGHAMRGERADHTLEPTALVHDAYLRLVGSDVPWQDRGHFFAVASRAMRRVLVDHARANQRQKRGGGALQVTLDEAHAVSSGNAVEITALDLALERLEEIDARKAEVVELHFFGGMTYEEVARVLGVSRATVQRDLKLAKAWIYREIRDGDAS